MKKRNRYITLIFSFTLVTMLLCFVFNFKTTYYQGVNYKVKSVKIPLYVKMVDFMSRNYHYKETLKDIIEGSESEEERVFKLFHWSHENIRPVPAGFLVVDDHVWHIIIRGYGASDQVSDVFTTLCNYAGVEAAFLFISPRAGKNKMPLSFVRINKKWRVFDPYLGVYFKDREGNLADIETIKAGAYLLEGKTEAVSQDYYADYIPNFPSLHDSVGLGRSKIQSPINRLLYELKKKNQFSLIN